MGNNLGPTFKTFDHYAPGTKTAISVKSLNLDAKSYQNGSQMSYKLNKDLKAIRDFTSYRLGTTEIIRKDINREVLKIVVNDQELNPIQLKNMEKVLKSANEKGIIVEAIIVK